MFKLAVIFSLISLSFSSFAGSALKCSVEITGTGEKTEVKVEAFKGFAPIALGEGKSLQIVFFNDDLRFTAIRPLTDSERAEANKGPGEPYVEGKIIAYSQVSAKGDVKSAMFAIPEVQVLCDSAE